MIDITTQISGGQIADALAGDDEECARCLDALSEHFTTARHISDLAVAIGDHSDNADRVSVWLLALASAIEEAQA